MKHEMLIARKRLRRLLRPMGAGSLMFVGVILVALAVAGVSSAEFGAKSLTAESEDSSSRDYALLAPTIESTLCPFQEETAASQPLFPSQIREGSQVTGEGERLHPLRLNDPVGGSIYLCPRPVMRG